MVILAMIIVIFLELRKHNNDSNNDIYYIRLLLVIIICYVRMTQLSTPFTAFSYYNTNNVTFNIEIGQVRHK